MARQMTRNLRMWQYALAAATLFAVVMACLPAPPQLPGDPSDKAVHAAAFAVLTVLARMAYPRASQWWVFSGLAAVGGLIEVLQSIPSLGREASLADWVVDIVAIAMALGLMRILLPFCGLCEQDKSETGAQSRVERQ